MRRFLLHIASVLHFAAIITFCGVTDVTDKEDAVHNNEIRCDRSETPSGDKENTEALQMSKPIEPLTLTPSRLHTLTTLRNTVGKLEAEFTQFKITHSGNIEQLKDKTVSQDHLIKIQKTTLGGLADDLTNNNKLLNEELTKHTTLITKLQEDQQTLQKKYAKITEENTALKRKQEQLEAEVTFLKDEMKSLWENIKTPETISNNMSRQTLPSVMEKSILPSTKKECDNQSPQSTSAQWNEDELLVVNLPTSNPFSPLQENPTKPPDNSKQDESKENPPHHTVPPTDNNNTRSKVIFLCDSNGKFLDTKQMFSSKQEVKYVRAPLIEHARNYLQNEIRTPPQMILVHTGTNDLERANSPEELVSNILIMITEASTKFPSSKILFSTLLPRNDIPTTIITSINDQVIKSCSKLPNVQLIKHDNLFANQLNILRDNKHILKRHIGFFAKNLKDAIHGRLRQRQHQFVSPHYPNTPNRYVRLHTAVLSRTHHPTPIVALRRILLRYHLSHHDYSNR